MGVLTRKIPLDNFLLLVFADASRFGNAPHLVSGFKHPNTDGATIYPYCIPNLDGVFARQIPPNGFCLLGVGERPSFPTHG